jgi:hypothetical protein
MSNQLHAPVPLPLGKHHCYPAAPEPVCILRRDFCSRRESNPDPSVAARPTRYTDSIFRAFTLCCVSCVTPHWILRFHRGDYKFTIFWDVARCSPIVYRRFGGTVSILRVRRVNAKQVIRASCWSLGLLFDPDAGGSTFLRNVGKFVADCSALHTRWHLQLLIRSFVFSFRLSHLTHWGGSNCLLSWRCWIF